MFTVCLAGFVIEIRNRFPLVKEWCEDYLLRPGAGMDCRSLSDNAHPDFVIEVTDTELAKEGGSDLPYSEVISIYRKIGMEILDRSATILHAAVLEKDGTGIAFLGESGAGKTTQLLLWKQHFQDSVRWINGDKPIIRVEDNRIMAYGTPWCGKEGYGSNSCTELTHFCFLEKSSENSIRRIHQREAASLLLRQFLIPSEEDKISGLFDIAEKVLAAGKFYILSCRKDESAAETAWRGMTTM